MYGTNGNWGFLLNNRGAGMCSGITDIDSQWAVRFDGEYKWFHMCEFMVFRRSRGQVSIKCDHSSDFQKTGVG